MKVTFVLPHPDMSGGIRVLAMYSQRLKTRGHEVTVVCAGPRPLPLRRRVKSVLRGRGWPRPRPERPSHFDAVDVECRRLKTFRPVVDSDVPDADVVVATWWETAEWVAQLAPRKGAKAYFMQDYGGTGQPFEKVRRTWGLPLDIITISNWLRDVIRNECGKHAMIVAPAVDLAKFSVPPRHKPAPTKVGFLYTPLPQKGTDICIEAVKRARGRVSDLRVVAFGPHAIADALPLPDNAEFAYQVPDDQLKSIYGACTGWLFGSRREGFGLPILEAMACRTPVIATPAGAAPELIDRGGGMLVKPEDPADMARAIEHIHALSETEWRDMSDLAYATAANYTWDDATDAFERALQSVIERAGATTA